MNKRKSSVRAASKPTATVVQQIPDLKIHKRKPSLTAQTFDFSRDASKKCFKEEIKQPRTFKPCVQKVTASTPKLLQLNILK